MTKSALIAGMIVEDELTLTYIEVANRLHIPETLLSEMQAEGLFNANNEQITHHDFIKVVKACRLHKDLGVNLAGAVLALELYEEINHLQQELNILKRHL